VDTRSLRRYEVFSGLAIALVLLSSTLDGRVAAGLAAALLAIGVVLFPETRRVGLLAAASALVVAAIFAVFASFAR